jgi:hypothetical protein
MKKIAILLACTMMLAGCTELLDDSNEPTTYTNQDLDGMYYGLLLSLRVEMNADDSYTIYLLEMKDCFESVDEANEYLDEADDESGVVYDTCVYEEIPLEEEDDLQITSELSSESNVPYIHLELASVESYFTCDGGDVITGDWVNDGEADCAEGEDEEEGAENNITSYEHEEFSMYLAADGNGVLIYPEGSDFSENGFPCITMNKAPQYPLMVDAAEILIEFQEDGGEIDVEDASTIPSDVIDLFASFDESFSESVIQSLASECNGVSFSQASLIFYIWATSLAEGNTDPGFSMYDFDVSDAGTSLSSASNETLAYVQMTSGDDWNWARVNLQLSVNDGAYMQCTNPQETIGNSCHLSNDDGDTSWTVGESVTLSEGFDDLCDGSSACYVRVKLIDSMSGDTIYESNPVTVGN